MDLVWLIGVITNFCYYGKFSPLLTSPDKNSIGYLSILIPVAGGLVIGIIARYGSEKIRGHGIPEALEAILVGRSRMEPKVAILKPISSAISIGTGGPFGAEGPIIMTGGAFGSIFAQMFHLSSAERKTLLVAGAAGGMAAIFSTPLAAVLISVELLLFEWKPRSLIPVGFSAIAAAVMRIPLLGASPLFPTIRHPLLTTNQVVTCIVVGLIAGLGSSLLTVLVYRFEDLFAKLPFHWMWWPAIGGLFIGIGGLINPRALGVGYDTIRDLLNGNLVGFALLSLLIIKALVWALVLGSGTSGGVLAPLLIMGGALGAAEAHLIPSGDVGLWSMVSMAAMMGGAMRSPLTAIVFTLELTHDFNVLPGLLIAAFAADAVTVLLMRRSILTEKVARHGHHIYLEYTVDPLELSLVRDVMDTRVPTISSNMKLSKLCDLISKGDPQLTPRQATPIVDSQGRLLGVITRGDLVRALANEVSSDDMTVLEAGSRDPIVGFPDETIRDAVERMLQHNVGRLMIVSREDKSLFIGYLGRSKVMQCWRGSINEETVREAYRPGFLRNS
jgi:chloride channel protein, CIC family